MTQSREKIRVAVNGYGVIGKRVADAVAAQDDMEVAGIADVEADWRLHVALKKGYELFASRDDRLDAMRVKGLEVAGTLGDLLGKTDVVVYGGGSAEPTHAHWQGWTARFSTPRDISRVSQKPEASRSTPP